MTDDRGQWLASAVKLPEVQPAFHFNGACRPAVGVWEGSDPYQRSLPTSSQPGAHLITLHCAAHIFWTGALVSGCC